MNAVAPSLRHKLGALTSRERMFLLVGGPSALLLLGYLLVPGESAPAVELAEPPIVVSATAAPPPIEPMAPAVAPAPPAPAMPKLDGIVLQGVSGGGPRGRAAIILLPGGWQRVVPIGREAMSGLKVSEVGLSHAILTSAAGAVRLEIGRAAEALTAPAAAPAHSGAASSGARPGDRSRETMQYRLGLEPRKSNGRIGGFAIRPGASLPTLQKAGLQPGDVLVAVNGQAVESEEKVMELAQEIATSYTAEFEYVRGGRRMKASMQVNKRP